MWCSVVRQHLFVEWPKQLLQLQVTRLGMVSIHRKHDKTPTDEPTSGSSTQGPAESSDNLPPNIVTITQVALQQKADEANQMYESCVSCGRRCEDNRSAGKLGKCRTGMKAFVSSHFSHTGEETCLVGTNGSGTIFFGNCNLKCIFCQNYDVSQTGSDGGEENDDLELAAKMIDLEKRRCHNINLVSPTHVVAPILRALVIAKEQGLRLPIVYNTGGYDSQETLALLDGVVDIYMPDMKYADSKLGKRYSHIKNYPAINQAAVKEMHRQVGDLVIDRETGIAKRGLLVRHLVLPNDQAGTDAITEFLATNIGTDTYVNVMAQYKPEHKAKGHKLLGRCVDDNEMKTAIESFTKRGFTRLDHKIGQRCQYNKLSALFQSDMEW